MSSLIHQTRWRHVANPRRTTDTLIGERQRAVLNPGKPFIWRKRKFAVGQVMRRLHWSGLMAWPRPAAWL